MAEEPPSAAYSCTCYVGIGTEDSGAVSHYDLGTTKHGELLWPM